MNKTQREYTIRRIREVQAAAGPTCECEPPDLNVHLRTAAVKGELKLLPVKKVGAKLADRVVDGERFTRVEKMPITDIFQPPPSYKVALAAHEDSVKAIENQRKSRDAKFQALIDRVELGEFEDGKEAIKEAHTIR